MNLLFFQADDDDDHHHNHQFTSHHHFDQIMDEERVVHSEPASLLYLFPWLWWWQWSSSSSPSSSSSSTPSLSQSPAIIIIIRLWAKKECYTGNQPHFCTFSMTIMMTMIIILISIIIIIKTTIITIASSHNNYQIMGEERVLQWEPAPLHSWLRRDLACKKLKVTNMAIRMLTAEKNKKNVGWSKF